MEGRIGIGIMLARVSLNFSLTLMRLNFFFYRLNAELVSVPNISGYPCLLLLKYRFALSGIKSAAVLLSKVGCLCVLDQASDLINPAAWTA